MKIQIVKSHLTVAVLVASASLSISFAQQVQAVDGSLWELQKSENDILIHTRTVESARGEVRQIRASTLLNRPFNVVIGVVRGNSDVWRGLPQTKEVTDFDVTPNKNSWNSYIVFDMPWPVRTYDLAVHCDLDVDNSRDRATITIASTPDLVKEKKRIKRMEDFHSQWVFEKLDDATTSVQYRASGKSKQVLPRWVTDPLVFKGLLGMLSVLRDRVEQSRAVYSIAE